MSHKASTACMRFLCHGMVFTSADQKPIVLKAHLLRHVFATHLGNGEDAFVRAPAALHQQWEEAKKSVGSLARVIGGECCCHAMCPISFACTGCAYKIPDPARREEIVQQRQWACIRYEQVKRQGLLPETVKMQVLIQRCNTELQEMELMEEYRHDEAYHPKLVLETGDQRTEAAAPVATQTLPGETPANHHARQGQCQSPRR